MTFFSFIDGNWFILRCFLDPTLLAYIYVNICVYIHIYIYVFRALHLNNPFCLLFMGLGFSEHLAYFCLFSEVHLSCWHLSLFSATLLIQPLPVASLLMTTMVLLVEVFYECLITEMLKIRGICSLQFKRVETLGRTPAV